MQNNVTFLVIDKKDLDDRLIELKDALKHDHLNYYHISSYIILNMKIKMIKNL